jgi:adenosylhomocysteine nucleosidase
MAVIVRTIGDFTGSVVLFAVEREAKAFGRLFPMRLSALEPGYQFLLHQYEDGQNSERHILVGLTGVGKAAARSCLEAILAAGARPRRVVVAGFAGALRTALPLAEVIVASEVVDEHGGRWEATWPEKRLGRVLSCDQMIGEPVRKFEFGKKHAADCVDMESSAVAEVCHRHGIPFGSVRVVSDEVNKPLSRRLMGLVESGQVSIRRVLWEVMRSPRMGIELVRLAKHTRRAADALAQRLRDLLADEVRGLETA